MNSIQGATKLVDNEVETRRNGRERSAVLGQVGEVEHDAVVLSLPGALAPARPTVSVIVPTLNESKNIAFVLDRIPSTVDEIIIVDGHSTDDTLEKVRLHYPYVRTMTQEGKGKGNALTCGFSAARGDIVVMLDGDGSTDPGEVDRFVDVLESGADFAKGTRFAEGGASVDISFIRRFGNATFKTLVNRLWGTKYTDMCYGYNAFWRRHLPTLNVDCNGFEVETLMNIRATQGRLNVVEVPSFESERMTGESHLSALRDGWRVLRTIVAERIRPQLG